MNLRERDKVEIFGMWPDDNAFGVAVYLQQQIEKHGTARVFYRAGAPAAICGACERWPGVWSAFAFGTEDFGVVAKEVSRYIKTELMSFLFERGAHRVDCQSHKSHRDAHRWLAWLGARRETTLKGWGRDGSDYYQYVWTR